MVAFLAISVLRQDLACWRVQTSERTDNHACKSRGDSNILQQLVWMTGFSRVDHSLILH